MRSQSWLCILLTISLSACTTDSAIPTDGSTDSTLHGFETRTAVVSEFAYVPGPKEKQMIDQLMKRMPPEGQRVIRRVLFSERPNEFSELRIEGDAQSAALLDSIYALRVRAIQTGGRSPK